MKVSDILQNGHFFTEI